MQKQQRHYLLFFIVALAALFLIPLALGKSQLGKTEPVGCTFDAKICPDGSTVGRILPDCEFAPCPKNNKQPKTSDLCIDFMGKPQDPEACANIPPEARQCTGDADCFATCSNGCLNRAWSEANPLIDCMAMPQYICGCVQGICQKR